MRSHFTQGSINSTGNATDVALNGNGFFVIGNGAGGYELTRDGNFTQAANGNLLSNGMSVMGYPALNGVVNTNAPLTAINIPVGAGAGIESDYDDEHDGESGFGNGRRARSFPRR